MDLTEANASRDSFLQLVVDLQPMVEFMRFLRTRCSAVRVLKLPSNPEDLAWIHAVGINFMVAFLEACPNLEGLHVSLDEASAVELLRKCAHSSTFTRKLAHFSMVNLIRNTYSTMGANHIDSGLTDAVAFHSQLKHLDLQRYQLSLGTRAREVS